MGAQPVEERLRGSLSQASLGRGYSRGYPAPLESGRLKANSVSHHQQMKTPCLKVHTNGTVIVIERDALLSRIIYVNLDEYSGMLSL